MVRLLASRPFVNDGDAFLWFCLAVRDSNIAGSVRLGLKGWWRAADLDNAVTLRLRQHDTKESMDQMKTSAKLVAYEVSKMFGDGGGDDDEGNTLIRA